MNPDLEKSSPYALRLGENEIRLVRLFKYNDGSISGELQHFHLERCPRFIATSYVWGDREDTNPIQLNGYTVEILNTARSFFEEMLAPDHYDYFPPSKTWWWMDCICINQDDPLERSAQVGLMSAVYQRALKTVIWLGQASEDSDEGLGFLKLLAEDWTVSRSDRSYWRDNIWPQIAARSSSWRAVERLLTRRWWERVWTLQEFLLSRDAAFYCGSKRITLDQMAYAIHAVWEWHQRHDRSIISRRGYEKGWNRFRMLEWYEHVSSLGQQLALVGILTYTATSSVTDPRDRLYSLLGLLSPVELDIIGRPDYESDACVIYIDFAISFINRYRTLDLLCIAPEMAEGNLPPGEAADKWSNLPSWVPNWSLQTRQSPPLLCMANQSANPEIGNFRPLHSKKYNCEYRACGPLTAITRIRSSDLRELVCAGIILDEIDGLGGGRAVAAGGESDEEEAVHIAGMIQSTSRENTTHHIPPRSNRDFVVSDEQHRIIATSQAVSITEQIARSLTLDRQDPYLGQEAPVQAFARQLRRLCVQSGGRPIQLLGFGPVGGVARETDAAESTAEIVEWFQWNKDLRIRGLRLGDALSAESEARANVDDRSRGQTTGRTSAGHWAPGQTQQSPYPQRMEQEQGETKTKGELADKGSISDPGKEHDHGVVMSGEGVDGKWCWNAVKAHSGSGCETEKGVPSCIPETVISDKADTESKANRDHEQRQATKFATRFRSTTYRRGKRLMVTETGILGMAPRLARKGDRVCILLGCSIPLVLRAEGVRIAGGDREGSSGIGRRYTVVGEAYVDGYMNGEVIDAVKRELRRVEDLRII
ncbi:heterokaryon incompatibility protein-domain-containing protein [Cladorrhinum sp. PSN259]|nr:heterokaryon incompatibility protein-domain-containing protein [Cladorrhinum sp. PSN259]